MAEAPAKEEAEDGCSLGRLMHSATTSNGTRQSAATASANWQLQLAASVISVCYLVLTITNCELPRSMYDSSHETRTV